MDNLGGCFGWWDSLGIKGFFRLFYVGFGDLWYGIYYGFKKRMRCGFRGNRGFYICIVLVNIRIYCFRGLLCK